MPVRFAYIEERRIAVMEKLSEQIRQIQTDIENEQERIQQLENQRDRILN